jgi:hypothetical protein
MRQRRLLLVVSVLAVVGAVVATAAISAPSGSSRAASPDILYGALGGSNVTSDLYTIDPNTGVATPIGPIGDAVTGLAFDSGGTLYGTTSNNSGANPESLITIDTTTGDGTLVGPLGAECQRTAADIAFSPGGTLFGWCEGPDDLVTINTGTGEATVVGNSGLGTFGDAMSFHENGSLYAALRGTRGSLFKVNTDTGKVKAIGRISDPTFSGGNPLSAGAFGCDGSTFYAIEHDQPAGPTALVTVAVKGNRGRITTIGLTLDNMDALAWGDC